MRSKKDPHGSAPPLTDNIDPERWFRAVADFTYDWESWHGPDGRLIWVNPAVERITGYSVADCLAMKDYPLPMIATENRPHIAAEVDGLRSEERQGQGEEQKKKQTHGGRQGITTGEMGKLRG